MNFLFHLYLSGDDPEILTGNLMGDFVKGRVGEGYPPGLRRGILLHRRIDSFAQRHPLFRRSRERLDPSFGLWRGVLVDMFYDHFLAQEWERWSAEPLENYLSRTRRMVERHRPHLPERLAGMLPVIFGTLIPSYGSEAGVRLALERMAARVRRSNPLAGGVGELGKNRAGLCRDFREFLPLARRDAAAFVAEAVNNHII